MRRIAVLIFLVGVSPAFAIEEPEPKLGPEAVPITTDREFLRTAPAEDYWIWPPSTLRSARRAIARPPPR